MLDFALLLSLIAYICATRDESSSYMVKIHLTILFVCVCSFVAICQDADSLSFRSTQLTSPRVADALKKYDDSAAREFKRKNLAYPPKDIYIRAFKLQNELELWARNNEKEPYRLIRLFRVCAISGSLGPKRTHGDRQVPEGFYFIDEYNPQSEYYLSLHLNYPNYSDVLLGKGNPGGDIYIHGGCVTVGCLPMTDEGIKELYTICLQARLNGEVYVPVHIFPTRLSENGMAYLRREFPKDPARLQFWADLKPGYDYFEQYHKLLPAMYTPAGTYAY